MSTHTERIPPWVSTFRTMLRAQATPEFGDDELSILSDWSGSSGSHTYKVYSFLIFSMARSPDWPRLRHELRQRFSDGRRISYKALSPSSHLQSQLQPFLSIADTLLGWCVTIAVHNSIKKLVTEDESCIAIWQERAKCEGGWKPAQFGTDLGIRADFDREGKARRRGSLS